MRQQDKELYQTSFYQLFFSSLVLLAEKDKGNGNFPESWHLSRSLCGYMCVTVLSTGLRPLGHPYCWALLYLCFSWRKSFNREILANAVSHTWSWRNPTPLRYECTMGFCMSISSDTSGMIMVSSEHFSTWSGLLQYLSFFFNMSKVQ